VETVAPRVRAAAKKAKIGFNAEMAHAKNQVTAGVKNIVTTRQNYGNFVAASGIPSAFSKAAKAIALGGVVPGKKPSAIRTALSPQAPAIISAATAYVAKESGLADAIESGKAKADELASVVKNTAKKNAKKIKKIASNLMEERRKEIKEMTDPNFRSDYLAKLNEMRAAISMNPENLKMTGIVPEGSINPIKSEANNAMRSRYGSLLKKLSNSGIKTKDYMKSLYGTDFKIRTLPENNNSFTGNVQKAKNMLPSNTGYIDIKAN
jgi:hypothetical protein